MGYWVGKQIVRYELIVTQWDVNSESVTVTILVPAELIVTQWDVNFFKFSYNAPGYSELIVTQWDVNLGESMGFYYQGKN